MGEPFQSRLGRNPTRWLESAGKGWSEGRPQHNAFPALNHEEWEDSGELNNRGRRSRRIFVLHLCVAAPLRITLAGLRCRHHFNCRYPRGGTS